jgi:hypothetical protein
LEVVHEDDAPEGAVDEAVATALATDDAAATC